MDARAWEDGAVTTILLNQFTIVERIAQDMDWGKNSPKAIEEMKELAEKKANIKLADPQNESGVVTPFTVKVAYMVIGPVGPVGAIDVRIETKVNVLRLEEPKMRGDVWRWNTTESKRIIAMTLDRPSDTFVDTMRRIGTLQAYETGKNIVWCVVSSRHRETYKPLFEQQGIAFIDEPLRG